MRPTVRIIVYHTLAGLCLAVAGTVYFVNHAIALISIGLLWVSLLLEAVALRLTLINHKERTWGNILFWVIVLASTPFCAWLTKIEMKTPISDLQIDADISISLSVNGDPGTDVHFTNTVIIPDGKHTELKNPRDCLVIPKKIGQTNLSLSISVHDGSAIDVDSLETIVSVPQDMKCFFEGWNGASWPKDFFRKSSVSEPGDFGPAEMKTFCFKELSLLHFNSTVLPEIKVVVSPNPHEWYSVLILTKAKQSTPRGTFFNVAFIAFQDDVPVKPFFGKILKTADGKKEYIAIPAELKVINE